jgi:hypothetical protein
MPRRPKPRIGSHRLAVLQTLALGVPIHLDGDRLATATHYRVGDTRVPKITIVQFVAWGWAEYLDPIRGVVQITKKGRAELARVTAEDNAQNAIAAPVTINADGKARKGLAVGLAPPPALDPIPRDSAAYWLDPIRAEESIYAARLWAIYLDRRATGAAPYDLHADPAWKAYAHTRDAMSAACDTHRTTPRPGGIASLRRELERLYTRAVSTSAGLLRGAQEIRA